MSGSLLAFIALAIIAAAAQSNNCNVTCANLTTYQACISAGSEPCTSNHACLWCGSSATSGKCREPFWQGNYSCPNGDGTRFWDFDCPPADNFTGCGSYCMNECDTTCKGYRRPEVVIDVFTDEGCTNQVGDRVYVDQPCTSIASGAAIGIDSFVNGTYHETDYLCSSCERCDAADEHTRYVCGCYPLLSVLAHWYRLSLANQSCSGSGPSTSSTTSSTTSSSSSTTSASTTSTSTLTSTTTSGAGTTTSQSSTLEPGRQSAAGRLAVAVTVLILPLLFVLQTM